MPPHRLKRMRSIPFQCMPSIQRTGRMQGSASHPHIRSPDASSMPAAGKRLPATDLPQTRTSHQASLSPDILPLPVPDTASRSTDTPFCYKDPFLHRSAALPSSPIPVLTPALPSCKTRIAPHTASRHVPHTILSSILHSLSLLTSPRTSCMDAGHSPPAIPLPPSASIRCRKGCCGSDFPLR